jgi:chromosome segregation ATPase
MLKTQEQIKVETEEREVWIKEVILENFMSYEYARIKFSPGINLICGPNGAGKSSILLAISVALGQISTERGRKLSDLIRRGKDIARVTLTFDNMERNGKRPIDFSNSDEFMLSRYLRKDGSYWYEADFKEISLWEVTELFKKFGINPSNMLLLMHQNTMEKFGLTNPQDKLKMLEEAVGFNEYREKIMEANQRLEKSIAGESEINELLNNAKEGLGYWKGMHEKLDRKNNLLKRKTFLERELAWSKILRQEETITDLKNSLETKEGLLVKNMQDSEKAIQAVKESQKEFDSWKLKLRESYYSLLEHEKEDAKLTEREKYIEKNFGNLAEGKYFEPGEHGVKSLLNELKSAKQKEREEIQVLQERIGELEKLSEFLIENCINQRVRLEVLHFKKSILEEEIKNLKTQFERAKARFAEMKELKKEAGERIETNRTQTQIEQDLGRVEASLDSIGPIPEETEEMYQNYSKMLEELEKKAKIATENKKRALDEINKRKRVWKKFLEKLIKEINPKFREILGKIDADGMARLINLNDIELAGLELWVGFRGSEPVLLDSLSQSSGEQTSSIMAFLLSIQSHLKSPFTAVDEFDLHMDPHNKERIYRATISSIKKEGRQCILITPSQLTISDTDVHITVIQKSQGRSSTREVSE